MGNAFLYANGGANPLNFKVVGGTAQPASPSENTIWIETDTPVNGWVFAPAEPDSPAAGQVWIRTVSTSPTAFNAVKQNILTVCPGSAYQYNGTEWDAKESQIFQNGSWNSFTIYLYKDGIWIGQQYTQTNAAGTVSNTETGFICTIGGTNGSVAYAGVAYDLTDFTLLKVHYTRQSWSASSQYSNFGVFVSSSPTPDNGALYSGSGTLANTRIATPDASGTVTLDVSDLSGVLYVWFGIYGYTNTGTLIFNDFILE